ncbi:MAG: NADH-quinone oxidoreductase subunit H [Ottowia sp.]|nr:NADH-quinone oxidoreductase subunit H [Ottowia sp.]
MGNALYTFGSELLSAVWWTRAAWPVMWNLLKIVLLLIPLMLLVAWLPLWEHKLLAQMQGRHGPRHTGRWGLLQPAADTIKLLTKEIIRPAAADRVLFFLGPVLALMPTLAAWVAIPFAPDVALANVNTGLLLLMVFMSTGIYGVVIAGLASSSRYAFLGALRASAQMVSTGVALGFCFLVIVMVSGSMNMSHIVMAQAKGRALGGMFEGTLFAWNWLPLLPVFLVYLIGCATGTNRLVEGGSEIVSAHMAEYSGMGFAAFFLAEYANMWLLAILATLLFLGGWLPPADTALFTWIPGWIWLGIKTCLMVSVFIWMRATFPRFRGDQMMRQGWKIFIPVTLVWLLVVACWRVSPWDIWM